MDKINFLATDDFPVSSDTLNRLQEATNMVSKLALQVGVNYKLSGCEITGSKAAPGVIVLNGEILPFLGGEIQPEIAIQETKITLDAFDVKYPEAYINRVAVFAAEGVYKWDDLKKVPTNQELDDRISSLRGEAPGFIMMWSGRIDRMPENYMLANGDIVRSEVYPDLALAYGHEHLESFALPNLSGRFIVGYDAAKPDYSEIGKTGGEEFHALTEDENAEHMHIMPWGENVNQEWNPPWGYAEDYLTGRRGSNSNDSDNAFAWSSPSGKGKPHENRPQFYTLAYLVKVKY